MLIWQGFGILALILPPVMAGMMDVLLYRVFEMDRVVLYGGVDPASIFGTFLGACMIWFGGRWLNQRPGKRLIDPESGETVEIRARHTLFWIPMQYWAILWPLGALVLIVLK